MSSAAEIITKNTVKSIANILKQIVLLKPKKLFLKNKFNFQSDIAWNSFNLVYPGKSEQDKHL